MTNLRLLNTQTGEVRRTPYEGLNTEDLIEVISGKERTIAGLTLENGKLRKDLGDQEEEHVSAGEIKEILTHCFEVLDMKRSKIVPGDERWQVVKKARKHFDVADLKLVPEGARKDSWHLKLRHRRDPKNLYAKTSRIEELRDKALGIFDEELPNGLVLGRYALAALTSLHRWEFDALRRCDCGHLRFQHNANYFPDPRAGRSEVHYAFCSQCDCGDFDTIAGDYERAKRREATLKVAA